MRPRSRLSASARRPVTTNRTRGGAQHFPYEFTSLTTPDPPHSWTAVHEQYDGGAMDGFWQAAQDDIGDGDAATGYYTGTELPFYYSLLENSALLDAAGVTWGIYNMNWDSVPFGNTDNVFVFWSNYAHDQRTRGSQRSFLNHARTGKLPQVSWLVSSFAHQKDEHPPADVSVGMALQQKLITAVREGPLWDSSAYLLTYDEHGADRVQLPGQRRTGAAARRSRRHQRSPRPVLVLRPATEGTT
jgi:phospholipase C